MDARSRSGKIFNGLDASKTLLTTPTKATVIRVLGETFRNVGICICLDFQVFVLNCRFFDTLINN